MALKSCLKGIIRSFLLHYKFQYELNSLGATHAERIVIPRSESALLSFKLLS